MLRGLLRQLKRVIHTTGRDRTAVTATPLDCGIRNEHVLRENQQAIRLQTATRPLMHDCVVYLKPAAVGEIQELLGRVAEQGNEALAENETTVAGVRLQRYPPRGSESRCIVCDDRIVSRLESIQDYDKEAFAIQQNEYVTTCPSDDRPQSVETHVGVHYECADELNTLIDTCLEEEADSLLGDAL